MNSRYSISQPKPWTGQILQSLNSEGVTHLRRAAFPLREAIRNRERNAVRWRTEGAGCHDFPRRSGGRADSAHHFAGRRPIAVWAEILHSPSEPRIADFRVRDAVENCVAMARSTETLVAAGDRLAAARAAVELVRAYDRVLENIRLVPLSLPVQQRVRDRLAPVAELLRKYRLR